MPRDLPALFGNRRLAPAALFPVGVALGLALVHRPSAHPIAIAPPLAMVVAAIAFGAWRQARMRKPHKVWRERSAATVALNLAVIMTSALSLAFVVAPWNGFDHRSVSGVMAGFAIGGGLTGGAYGVVGIALQRRGEGPFKKLVPAGGYWLTGVSMFMIGPIGGFITGIPLYQTWIETAPRPGSDGAMGWALGAPAIMGAVIAIGWAGLDWLKARAKARRAAAR